MKKNNQTYVLPEYKWIKLTRMIVIILILDLNLTGCMTYLAATYDAPPSHLNQIKEGVDRKTVESILGRPKQKNNNVYTYEFNKVEFGGFWGPLILDVVTFGTSAVYYGDIKKSIKADKAQMRIVYGPKNKVISINYDQAENQYLQWIISSNRMKEIELLCASANNGYAHAQAIQAMRYRYGLWSTEIDNQKAYLWLKLADFGGQSNVRELLTTWAEHMTSQELETAEKSFQEWEPVSCQN